MLLLRSVALAGAVFLLLPPNSPAQEGASGGAPAEQHSVPDLTGIWQLQGGPVETTTGEPIPFQPWSQKIFDETVARLGTDAPFVSNRERCLPQGPDAMFNRYMIQFFQLPDKLYILSEWGNEVRHVYMDEGHPEDLSPSWNGHSVGRWEGNTLVVDTIGFNDKTQLTTLAVRGRTNMVHSAALHIIERFSLSEDGMTLRNETTIDDPEVFTKPWTTILTSERRPEAQVFEFVCADAPLDLEG